MPPRKRKIESKTSEESIVKNKRTCGARKTNQTRARINKEKGEENVSVPTKSKPEVLKNSDFSSNVDNISKCQKKKMDCQSPKDKENVLARANENENNSGKRNSAQNKITPSIRAMRSPAEHSRNIIHYLTQAMAGMRCTMNLSRSVAEPVNTLIRNLQLLRTARPFDRRCTALEWHPNLSGYLAVASKGGDIICLDVNKVGEELFIEGGGAGGSVQALHFMPDNDQCLLTASIDGTVTLHDLETKQKTVLLDTMNCVDHWYSSVDVQNLSSRPLIAAGRNNGMVSLVQSENATQCWTHKLHKSKVTHVEFNKHAPWMVCTASLDKMCKLWDIRMIKDKKSYLHQMEHTKAINSAYFNPRTGFQLLTTDQQDEIRIYSGPNWCQPVIIKHPHRFFQHITPIKACWHPLVDVIAVGRYPDDNFPGSSKDERRTVDIFCARTGKMQHQLYDASASGLVSLNQFSPQGDMLASTMGVNILIWSRKELVEKKQEELMTQFSEEIGQTSNRRSSQNRTDGPKRKTKTKKDKELTLEQKTAKIKLSKLNKD